MTKLSIYSNPTILAILLVALTTNLSNFCAGQQDESSNIASSQDDQDEIILSRLDLARLSKIRIDMRQMPDRKCAVYTKELRHMLGADKEASATGDTQFLNQVVRVLAKRKLPFGNSQPVLSDLTECLKSSSAEQSNPEDVATSKREVIASPPDRNPLFDQTSGRENMKKVLNEFKEVRNNVKDFGQDLYLKQTAKDINKPVDDKSVEHASVVDDSSKSVSTVDQVKRQKIELDGNSNANPHKESHLNQEGVEISNIELNGGADQAHLVASSEPTRNDVFGQPSSELRADPQPNALAANNPINSGSFPSSYQQDNVNTDASKSSTSNDVRETTNGKPSPAAYLLDPKHLAKKGATVIPVIRKNVLNAQQKIVDYASGDQSIPGTLRYDKPADDDEISPEYDSPNGNNNNNESNQGSNGGNNKNGVVDDGRNQPEDQRPAIIPVNTNKIEVHYVNKYNQQSSDDDGTRFSQSNKSEFQHQSIKRVLDDPKGVVEVDELSSKPYVDGYLDDDHEKFKLVHSEPEPTKPPNSLQPIQVADTDTARSLEIARYDVLKEQYEAAAKREQRYLAELKASKALVSKQEQLIEELSDGNKLDKKELTDPVKMAGFIYEKQDPDEDQLTRCYRYYLLYTYPKKMTKATVKTIANLSLRVPNIEIYKQLVSTTLPYSDLMKRTSNTLVNSSNKRAIKVGLDMLDCAAKTAQPPSYQSDWHYNNVNDRFSAAPAFGRSPFSSRFSRIPSIPPIPPMPPMPQFNHEIPNFQFY